VFIRFKTIPSWAILSLAANGLLVSVLCFLLVKGRGWLVFSNATASTPDSVKTAATVVSPINADSTPAPAVDMSIQTDMGPRHQLTYQQWVELLAQEATATATNQPQSLAVLLGDSLSLWFPVDLLPAQQSWLNQGISGETTAGLLDRLALLEQTQPQAIFVMIGINDLIRGIDDKVILKNYRDIIRSLRRSHPQSQIVVQSILPHAAAQSTWEGRDRLLNLPNERIRQLNQRLEAIAIQQKVDYLNLYPLFADQEGNLQMLLSTDGLHLNQQGYLVWRTALEIYHRTE
jgi:lysophospholipase L1-like esterase